jgi:hypothetical protein
VIVLRIIGEAVTELLWDSCGLEAIIIPERLAKWRRDPRLASYESADMCSWYALKRGYDLNGGGTGADYTYPLILEVIAASKVSRSFRYAYCDNCYTSDSMWQNASFRLCTSLARLSSARKGC